MPIAINHSSKKVSRIPYKSYNILILNKEGFPLTGAALCLRISLDWIFTLEIRGFPAEKVRKRNKFLGVFLFFKLEYYYSSRVSKYVHTKLLGCNTKWCRTLRFD